MSQSEGCTKEASESLRWRQRHWLMSIGLGQESRNALLECRGY
jgi:hypothetical protein